MDEYREDNRALWNQWAQIHPQTDFYDMQSLRDGGIALHSIEREEVGDVRGKSMLHLQCHFGRDTLSWVRLGAEVTGVDFSGEAIAMARKFSAELGIPATFIESDLYAVPDVIDKQFDIVFTSYGVLYWLPDMTRWAQVVAHCLKPGGTFYIIEYHPITDIFDDDPDVKALDIRFPYFQDDDEPHTFEATDSYADRDAKIEPQRYHLWSHTLGDIVTALLNAGLRLEYLHEFPFTTYQQLGMLLHGDDGYWRFPNNAQPIPLMFSIRATKPD
ncbi:MAG: class I SAM-dependent methyltransferase [Chloroflexi bacterium]|nr:MAG: class I SAM-dependent methyltransferase [Chloroflexota bacterium]